MAKDIFRAIVVSMTALTLVGSATGSDVPAVPSLTKPRIVIDLAKFGWAPPPSESNRSFFKDISIEKLEALDDHTKIAFLSEDLLVAYHTKQEGKNWRTAKHELEAFFIRTADGSLLATKLWPTSTRKDNFDFTDSESRLIPLSAGRFLVHASGILMLYASNLELLNEKKLEPSRAIDLWAAQSIRGSSYIFLRHGFPSNLQATYSWLNPESLEAVHQLAGSFAVPLATENSIIIGSPSGIQEVDLNGDAQTIWDEQQLRGRKIGVSSVLSSRLILLEGATAVGVIERGHGILWWDQVAPDCLAHFSVVSTAAAAPRFAVDLSGPKKTSFHGVKIINGSPVMFIYDAHRGKSIAALRLKFLDNGEYNFALSPNGTQVAVFDAHGLKIYSLDAL